MPRKREPIRPKVTFFRASDGAYLAEQEHLGGDPPIWDEKTKDALTLSVLKAIKPHGYLPVDKKYLDLLTAH